jgi:hypothetical protein
MRILTASLVLAAINGGCVSDAVNQHAVNQSLSVADMRYQEVLDNLARIAHNNGVLPSYGVISGGAANVSDTVSADALTLFTAAVNGFAQETLNASAAQSPELMWTIDPVVAEPSIEALKYACLWALYGPFPEGSPQMELLRAPRRDDIYGCKPDPKAGDPPTVPFHFDVASQLYALPSDWLGRGCRSQVPKCACYKSHCGDTYVWVTPDHLSDLSAFTLVVLDIATIYPQSLLLQRPTAQVSIAIGGAGSTGNKITETWDACQEADASGTIRISRPRAYTQGVTRFPDIVPDKFFVAPLPGQPQFKQTPSQAAPAPDNRTGAQDNRLDREPTYASFAPAGQ